MPDQPSPKPAPAVENHVVRCRQCERVFAGFTYKIVPTANEVTLLLDADGDTVYDLVKVCKCKVVFHWHTNDKTIRDNTAAFERLMAHYERQSAIIADDKSTG
jgi:hypothetical protein